MNLKILTKPICILSGALLLHYHQATGNPTLESSLPEQQLAAYIQYPPMLRKTGASVIAVSFSVSNKGIITQVQAHSRIQALDDYLVRCLYGKRLRLSGLKQKIYLVRLRFRPGTDIKT